MNPIFWYASSAMTTPPTAFVAYPSTDKALATMIFDAIAQANAKSNRIRYKPWEFNDIAGNPLISPILNGIGESSFVVADITYLNPNVIYEIGFAIGNRKRAYLIRHSATIGDKPLAQEAGIFDTLGYQQYDDINGLSHYLTSYINPEPLTFGSAIDRLTPVYVIEPPVTDQAAVMMTSRLKKARYRYRSFNPTEDVRLSAVDAIRQVAASAGVLVSLHDPSTMDWAAHNIRSLFVAGLAQGVGKPILILCPHDYTAPLDVRDAAKMYRHPDDIAEHIANLALEITDYSQRADPPVMDAETLLQSLRMGDPTAENEMATLANYFLRTDQYSRAVHGEVNLVVGRKGSGKTALFIQVRDKIRNDKRNIVVDLKPEGYQLLKLKEEILSYLTEGARQHLITAFWEYLLLLEVAYKILEKDRPIYKFNHEIRDLYLELEEAYKVENFSAEGDFSERLLMLSQRISEEYRAKFKQETGQKLTTEQVSELLYTHDIPKLRQRISQCLKHKQSVWVLFDNLDKGWSTQGIDQIDAIVLRCLIDAGRKVERDMQKSDYEFHCIVFVRNDVYEHLMQNSADYGKEMRAVLDWTDSDLLQEMLRLRLVFGLDRTSVAMPFDQLWRTICVSHYQGNETSNYIIERSLMRPRNMLKIFNHCRGFANNFNHPKITDQDIEKGLSAYSQDLLIDFEREMTSVFPNAKDLLYYFIDVQGELARPQLEAIIHNAGVSADETDNVINALFYYGVLGLRLPESDLYIYNVNYDPKILRIRTQQLGSKALFVINPAFWPVLGIRASSTIH